jgi:hypothetical protein
MAPRHAQGFGGGLMGRYRADGHGLVRFSYPGWTRRWEIGQWRISATPPATKAHLTGATTVVVVASTVATGTSGRTSQPQVVVNALRGTPSHPLTIWTTL